ncbi:MAG TPA: DMT family transporter [Patescibacteria group bacterium]|nr:DMT family transporter [Patescibacteria group bacterium]
MPADQRQVAERAARGEVTRTALLTLFAMTAFAANSLLCRRALGTGAIDPATFALVRVASGALVLWGVTRVRARGRQASDAAGGRGPGGRGRGERGHVARGRLARAAMLSLYLLAFSFAYLSLGAGTGALVLFASVQATMMTAALASGERPRLLQWIGLAAGLAGFVELVLPGLTAPSPGGAALMAAAGVGWGLYSVLGRGAGEPLAATAQSFAASAPIALVAALATWRAAHLSWRGALLAAASGVVASGFGYVAWYAALARLDTTRAAAVQLSVPVLAAAGGVLFLSEPITPRLTMAALGILGGVGLALYGRRATPAPALAISPTDP